DRARDMRVLKAFLITAAALACAACGTTGGVAEEPEPILIGSEPVLPVEMPALEASTRAGSQEGAEGEVPVAVAETERPQAPAEDLEEVVVEAQRERYAVIQDLVAEAQMRLHDVEL